MGETQKIVTGFLQAQSTLNSLLQCLNASVQWVKLLFLRVEKYTLESSERTESRSHISWLSALISISIA